MQFLYEIIRWHFVDIILGWAADSNAVISKECLTEKPLDQHKYIGNASALGYSLRALRSHERFACQGEVTLPVSEWLTTNFVEQIHKAHLKSKPTAEHIAKLSNATLAGLIEYGCLKRSIVDLPGLPVAIADSPLGRGLNRISSEIGLRNEGNSEAVSISHEPREIEFVSVRDAEEFLGDPVQMMFMRITQTAKQAGFSSRTTNELQGALGEMIANAIEHSNSPIPIIVGYHIRPQIASFVVADVGRGVYDSLRENPNHQDVTDHCEAIRRALKDGVSRHSEARGNGFRPIFKALAENWGVLRFRSRKGCRTLNGIGLSADQGTNHYPPELPGFQVSVTCRSTEATPEFPVI